MSAHWPIAPILLPFLAGVLLLGWRNQPIGVRRAVSQGMALAQVLCAVGLLMAVSGGDILVYRLGDWPAPWGIVLVADRLAAWMVLITTFLACGVLVHASDGLDERGAHFHVLFHMQLLGLTGAFLTGDLFNLFVSFEILLIASYSLLLHGGGAQRVRAGLHYVVLNLIGSTVFLFAAGLIYAALGTLNLADLANKAASVSPDNLALARAGGLLLLAVFALKAALLPLALWLPGAYASTSAPVAALFAIMTKVGVYAILRFDTLVFGDAAGALAGLYSPWLMPLALTTLGLGMIGVLAADHLKRLAAWWVLASVGTLICAFSLGTDGMAAGLYYLPHSTFSVALMFLLAEVLARRRGSSACGWAPAPDMAQHALWGALYFAAAVALAGLPPLSGFIGKFLLLRGAPGQPWLWAVVLLGALLGVIALATAGSKLFLSRSTASGASAGPAPEVAPVLASPNPGRELLAVLGLLGLIVALTLGSGPAFDFAHATAVQIEQPDLYVTAVLGKQP